MVAASAAVEVLHNSGDSDRPRWTVGSGYRIGGRLILTAAHNVGGGELKVRVHEDGGRGHKYPATVVLDGCEIPVALGELRDFDHPTR